MDNDPQYGIDADIISYAVKDIGNARANIIAASEHGDTIILVPFAYYEVKRGLLYKDAPHQLATLEWIRTMGALGLIGTDQTEVLLNNAMSIYGRLTAKGTPMSEMDIFIAAYCRTYGLTLVTHNIKHYENVIGLELVDWTY